MITAIQRAKTRELAEEARERRQIIRDCIGALYEAIEHEDADLLGRVLGTRQRAHLYPKVVLVTEWLEQFEDSLSDVGGA